MGWWGGGGTTLRNKQEQGPRAPSLSTGKIQGTDTSWTTYPSKVKTVNRRNIKKRRECTIRDANQQLLEDVGHAKWI